MKKLIAVLAMVALVSGAAFAEISVSGHVIGTVNLIQGDSGKFYEKDDDGDFIFMKDGKVVDPKAGDPQASGSLNRVRVEASGESEDGAFGAWVRIEGGMAGNAWWKPMDMLLLRVGSNGGDGYYGKDGITRWMFYQTVSDTGVVNAGNAWGGGYAPTNMGTAFYGGYGDNSFMLEFKPIDVLGINLQLPFENGGKAEDFYKHIIAQADLNLEFGNIALTFVGNNGKLGFDEKAYDDMDDMDIVELQTLGFTDFIQGGGSKLYLYLGLPLGENIALDVGASFTLPVKGEKGAFLNEKLTYNAPIAAGIGFKFGGGESFGIKARFVVNLGGSLTSSESGVDKVDVPMTLLFDILPSIPINESATLFVSAGIGMRDAMKVKQGTETITYDALFSWHINPYIQIGSEWGPKFLAGVKIWSSGSAFDHTGLKDYKGYKTDGYAGSNFVNFAIPIAINVGF